MEASARGVIHAENVQTVVQSIVALCDEATIVQVPALLLLPSIFQLRPPVHSPSATIGVCHSSQQSKVRQTGLRDS